MWFSREPQVGRASGSMSFSGDLPGSFAIIDELRIGTNLAKRFAPDPTRIQR